MASLQELQSFLTGEINDEYLKSILQSDIRNIFPKYELCKIELAKTLMAKLRLIMHNANDIMSLQMHHNRIKAATYQGDECSLKEEIHALSSDQQHTDYEIGILSKKEQVQELCTLLSKPSGKNSNSPNSNSPNSNSGSYGKISGSQKWAQYLLKNTKKATISEQGFNRELIMLADSIQLQNCQPWLLQGTATSILSQRVHKHNMKGKLVAQILAEKEKESEL